MKVDAHHQVYEFDELYTHSGVFTFLLRPGMFVQENAVAVGMAFDFERYVGHVIAAQEMLSILLWQVKPPRNDSDQIGADATFAELLDQVELVVGFLFDFVDDLLGGYEVPGKLRRKSLRIEDTQMRVDLRLHGRPEALNAFFWTLRFEHLLPDRNLTRFFQRLEVKAILLQLREAIISSIILLVDYAPALNTPLDLKIHSELRPDYLSEIQRQNVSLNLSNQRKIMLLIMLIVFHLLLEQE